MTPPPPPPDPALALQTSTGKPTIRWAVLLHQPPGQPAHCDLLLQQPSRPGLLTWRLQRWLASPPSKPPTNHPPHVHEPPPDAELDAEPAEQLPDHRAVYLDYQGVLSGGRGSVQRIDSGLLLMLDPTPATVRAKLRSETGRTIALTLLRESPPGTHPARWLCYAALLPG